MYYIKQSLLLVQLLVIKHAILRPPLKYFFQYFLFIQLSKSTPLKFRGPYYPFYIISIFFFYLTSTMDSKIAFHNTYEDFLKYTDLY